MKAVKDDYYDLYGKYPQTIREFAAEKLKTPMQNPQPHHGFGGALSIDVGISGARRQNPTAVRRSRLQSPKAGSKKTKPTKKTDDSQLNQPIEDRGYAEVTPHKLPRRQRPHAVYTAWGLVWSRHGFEPAQFAWEAKMLPLHHASLLWLLYPNRWRFSRCFAGQSGQKFLQMLVLMMFSIYERPKFGAVGVPCDLASFSV